MASCKTNSFCRGCSNSNASSTADFLVEFCQCVVSSGIGCLKGIGNQPNGHRGITVLKMVVASSSTCFVIGAMCSTICLGRCNRCSASAPPTFPSASTNKGRPMLLPPMTPPTPPLNWPMVSSPKSIRHGVPGSTAMNWLSSMWMAPRVVP